MKDKTKLLILFGGVSSEHEVSRVSASSILTHINGEKYEIYTVGITKEGNWFLTSSPAVRIGDGSWEQDPANKNVALSLDRASRGLVVLENHIDGYLLHIFRVFQHNQSATGSI